MKWIKNTQLQSLLLLGLGAFFLAHFLLLSPSSLEEDFTGVRIIHPRDLLNFLKNEPAKLAKDVPEGVAPSYSLRDLVFFSAVEHQPNWKLLARKSNVYQTAQIMHGLNVTILLQDETTIDAKEAVMYIDKNEVKFYGDVTTHLKDGTVVRSQYARALTSPVTVLEVPLSEMVTGEKIDPKRPDGRDRVTFQANGLSYIDAGSKDLNLLSQVIVNIQNDDLTVIRSDRAVYTHEKNFLNFTMDESTPLDRQFVSVHKPDLDVLSRSLDAQMDSKQTLQKITALHDVSFRDTQDPEKLVTGTSGRAVYYPTPDEIHLTDFPQVYQEGDTITGDVIVFNRPKDTIEVKQSNAIYNK